MTGNYLYDYQTLITGIFALIGAVLLWWQIRQAESHEAHRRARARAAARAVLPVTLGQVTGHVLATAALLVGACERFKGKSLIIAPVVPHDGIPRIDPGIFEAIAATIAADETPQIEDLLAHVAARLQILEARMEGMAQPGPNESIMPSNIHACLIDCAAIHAWVGSLYPYARRQTDEIRPCEFPAAVEDALRQLGIHPEEWPLIYKMVPKEPPRLGVKVPKKSPYLGGLSPIHDRGS